MVRVKEWSELEISKLEKYYPSSMAFDEILLELPQRTSNAVRLKASRLGLRRPLLMPEMVQALKVRMNGDEAEPLGYIIKCKECGSWIQTDRLDEMKARAICCESCGSLYEIVDSS